MVNVCVLSVDAESPFKSVRNFSNVEAAGYALKSWSLCSSTVRNVKKNSIQAFTFPLRLESHFSS